MTVIILIAAACTDQVPIQKNVKVERGEVVLRVSNPEPEPFIKEIPATKDPLLDAPVPKKPEAVGQKTG